MTIKPSLKFDRLDVPTPMTGEELFQMGDLGRAELIKGELIGMTPAGYIHGRIENRFGVALNTFVEENKLGVVLVGDVGIYTGLFDIE